MDFIIGVDDPPPTYAQIIEDTEEQRHQKEQHQSDIQMTSNSNSSISGLSLKAYTGSFRKNGKK